LGRLFGSNFEMRESSKLLDVIGVKHK
jgi:hypothetical protein